MECLMIITALTIVTLATIACGFLALGIISRNRASIAERRLFASHTVSLSPKTTYRIGVLCALSSEPVDDLIAGMYSACRDKDRITYTIELFTGDNNRVILFKQALKALESVDILIPFGLNAAMIAYEAAHELHSEKSIFVTGVSNAHVELIKKSASPRTVMGVINEPDYAGKIKRLRILKPSLNTLLIITTDQFSPHDEAIIGATARAHQIDPLIYHLKQTTHIAQQLATISEQFDAVWIPTEITADTLETIVAFCKERNVPLCGSGRDAVVLGATLSFGESYRAIGCHAGKTISHLVERNVLIIEDLHTSLMEHYTTYIESNALWEGEAFISRYAAQIPLPQNATHSHAELT